MDYKYSVDRVLYKDEIDSFEKNSIVLNKIKKTSILGALIAVTIAIAILFFKRISKSNSNEDITYIFVEYLIIFIIVIVFTFIFTRLYVKYHILNKILLKNWQKEYVHVLRVENDLIHYISPQNTSVQLDYKSLKEVKELDNIIVLFVIKEDIKNPKRKGNSIIIVPKNIFESESSLNKFKKLLK